ncbi:hypothetical protein NDU88_012256 [Pleurodeles waltl]|uniref:Reverse transcriptase n=1 Tax=Pleurodeles waltl TaxID=8319 RepID=A0AAV7R0Z0_PLEWA|nr:hypothetical protein NDU88_012256 [Pleurodeles waltl]
MGRHSSLVDAEVGPLISCTWVPGTYLTPSCLNKIDPGRRAGCARCGFFGAYFLHLAWTFRLVSRFWHDVVERVVDVTGLGIEATPMACLLGVVQKPWGRTILYKLAQLALVLARHRVEIGWMSARSPLLSEWIRDLMEWGVPEEQHMRCMRRDEKVLTDLEVWGTFLERFSGVVGVSSADNIRVGILHNESIVLKTINYGFAIYPDFS